MRGGNVKPSLVKPAVTTAFLNPSNLLVNTFPARFNARQSVVCPYSESVCSVRFLQAAAGICPHQVRPMVVLNEAVLYDTLRIMFSCSEM
jgi:hypothetical protein